MWPGQRPHGIARIGEVQLAVVQQRMAASRLAVHIKAVCKAVCSSVCSTVYPREGTVHDTEVQSRRPLTYIVPVYDPQSEEHYYHIYRFLTALAQEVPLHVVVEHARGRP
ncbi:MAG: hypothetical protein C4345_09170, partial [Chloroflexota bacterium]